MTWENNQRTARIFYRRFIKALNKTPDRARRSISVLNTTSKAGGSWRGMGQRENWKTIKNLQLHLPRNCCSEQAWPDPSPGWGSLLLSCRCPPKLCWVPAVPAKPPARSRHSCAPKESQKHGENQQGFLHHGRGVGFRLSCVAGTAGALRHRP